MSDLSSLWQKDINTQKSIDKKSATSQKYSWIKPLIASYSYTKNNQFGSWSATRYFRVALDQPIFKSGGIYFAIKYADANEAFSSVVTKIKEQNLIKSLYSTVLNLKKIDLELKILKYQLSSANIDIDRKKEQFDAGVIDSSFLDEAILKKSGLEEKKLELLSQKEQFLSEFKKLSDKDYRSISLPTFKTVSKKEFISKNLELQKLKKQKKSQRELKNMTISSFLPTISLFGEYSNKDDDFKLFKQQQREYKDYGIKISMPLLDINTKRKIEVEKLKYIKSKIAISQKQRELDEEFKLFDEKLKFLQRKIDVANRDIKMYKRLIKNTKDALRAGEKTKMDLINMQNSYEISKVKKLVDKIDIQLHFLNFYAKLSDEI
jgi:outer membrane protein TolC